MTLFVIERFLPDLTADALGTLAREQQGLRGVSYRHSIYVPADDTCFCLVEAESAEAVSEANAGARLPFERVVEALQVFADRPGITGAEMEVLA